MNEWMETFIVQCLADVPWGKYRQRTEKELRDHMAALRQDMTEAEVLQAMGDPERLRKEYEAAWERSLPARLEELLRCFGVWFGGCVIMFGVYCFASYEVNKVWWRVCDSKDKWGMLVRNLLFSSRLWLPFIPALIVGAFFLAHTFQTSRRPVWRISVGLSLHWTIITAYHVYWEAFYDNIAFWEKLKGGYLPDNAGYYSFSLVLCILFGVVFGRLFQQKAGRRRELA